MPHSVLPKAWKVSPYSMQRTTQERCKHWGMQGINNTQQDKRRYRCSCFNFLQGRVTCQAYEHLLCLTLLQKASFCRPQQGNGTFGLGLRRQEQLQACLKHEIEMFNMIMLHILWADYIKRYYGHVQLQEGELAEKKKQTQHKNKTPKQEEISQKESERKR